MEHLGSLTGTGHELIDKERLGPVRYDIRVYRSHTLKDGSGAIEADGAIIDRMMKAGETFLELEGDGTVAILVSRWDVLADRAQIVTTGPIPGF